jgi:hypothetical protein
MMVDYKRDLIAVYKEFANAFTDGDIPDFDMIIAILGKYGIKVSEELLVEETE